MFKRQKINRIKRELAGLKRGARALVEVFNSNTAPPSDELVLQYTSLCMDIGQLEFDLEQLQRG